MRAGHVIGAFALVALAGCSSPAPADDAAAPKASAATVESQAAMPACSDVFVPDKPVTGFDDQTGCANKEGVVQSIAAIDCPDGTRLWPVDATTGAPAGYWRQGQVFRVVKGEITTDKDYKEAYESCVNAPPAAGSPAPSASAE